MLKLFGSKGFKSWKAKSWIVQSLSRLEDMELPKKTFQNLGFQVLKTCKISELWLPSLQTYFQMSSCRGRPSHERHNSWQGSNVEVLYPEKFQDLESQVLNSAIIVKAWGHGVAKKCNMSKLGFKVLKKCKISELWLPSLEKIFPNVFMSWKTKSWKTIRGKGLMLKVFTRKFQDLESQVLNRAIIVKSWGHGVAKK